MIPAPVTWVQVASRLAPGQAGAAGATSLTDKRQQVRGCSCGALPWASLLS
jgi:hypothetical protein